MLSAIYKAIISCREFFYTTGLKKTKRLPFKVISIGNLTVGGTGKTPATIALAEEAKKRGFSPCILTRGYKGKAKGPCLVKSRNPLSVMRNGLKNEVNASRFTHHASRLYGDEPVLMAERLKDVPIVKCADRYKGGLLALNSSLITHQDAQRPHSSLIFILDDGFQHWALHRDIDILLIDATRPFGNGRLFPEGILREPLKAMERADVIVLTKTDAVTLEQINFITPTIRQYNPDAPLYLASHKAEALIDVTGGIKELDFINQKKVYVFSGIADPAYFLTVLSSTGVEIVGSRSFKDHYHYKQHDIDKIVESSEGLDIITTEKDLMKLKDLKLPQNLFALRIEFSINEEFYKHVFGRVQC